MCCQQMSRLARRLSSTLALFWSCNPGGAFVVAVLGTLARDPRIQHEYRDVLEANATDIQGGVETISADRGRVLRMLATIESFAALCEKAGVELH